jgi:hypothetical protein
VSDRAKTGPNDDPADVQALARCSDALARAVEAALPRWVERVVTSRWSAQHGEPPPARVEEAARSAGRKVAAEVGPALRNLLATDVDEQRSNPLSLLRSAVVHPTAVLRDAGVLPVRRDAGAERLFPDDPYDLTPGSFGDVDPALHEPGLVWGAAKAHVVLRRRRAEGRED